VFAPVSKIYNGKLLPNEYYDAVERTVSGL
jgi:hypothetical protein